MYTQCPDCLTVYRVGPDPVASGRGQLRCGHCGTVFDALATLTEKLPGDGFQTLPLHLPAGVPPVLEVPAMHPQGPPELHASDIERPPLPGEWLARADMQSLHAERSHFRARELSGRSAQPPVDHTARRAERREPGLAREFRLDESVAAPRPSHTRPPAERPSPAWAWGSALLALGLLLQVAIVERERWLADARIRPWLERACVTLGCQLPLPANIDGLRLLAREVRPHEHLQGALIISGTLRNDAEVPAPFPIVEVRLADLNDRVVAMRRFRPEEYLADRSAVARGFPAQSSLPLLFEVSDPGQDALAFEFEFLLP